MRVRFRFSRGKQVAKTHTDGMSIQVLKKRHPELYRQIWERGLKAAKHRQYAAKRKARIRSDAGLILF